MKKMVANKIKALWQDESAQGATEYILLLAIVVGLAMVFGTKIKTIVNEKMGSIDSAIQGFKPESGQ
jgi:Flp pilus assembly pilin Flp